jgi:predicted phage terminase large subunit-like protein
VSEPVSPGCEHPACRFLPGGQCAQASGPTRPGLTHNEAAALIGVSKSRLSQIASEGTVQRWYDEKSVLWYDRASVEAHAARRAKRPPGSRGRIPTGIPRSVRRRRVSGATTTGWDPDRAQNRNPLAPGKVVEKSPQQKAAEDLRRVTLEIGRRATEELRQRCLKSLAYFVRVGWEVLEPGTPLAWNWHIDAICEHVQRVLEDWARARSAKVRRREYQDALAEMKRTELTIERRRQLQGKLNFLEGAEQRELREFKQVINNLLINIPPGTAKSRIVSVFAPAWMWLHHPDWRVICLSANPAVALRDADYARQLIESTWYQQTFKPDWEIREDQDAKGNFGNTRGGTRVSGGITMKITGQRADAIIVDDPNDAKEVHSETIRASVNHNWDTAIRNRVNDLEIAVRIGIMQRLHEEDWSGHVLSKRGKLRWAHLCLPMEYEDPSCKCRDCQVGHTPLGWSDPRKDPEFLPESAYGPMTGGKVLHPDRFPLEVLQDELETEGTTAYAGQKQQRPAPADGVMFKRAWFHAFDELPERDHGWAMYADLNAKKTTDGSRTCIQVWVRKGPDRFLVDQFVGITTPNEGIQRVREMRLRYPKIRKMVIEDKANGPAVIESMSREFQGVIAWSPGAESKESRAFAVLSILEGGNVFIPRFAGWRELFIHELIMFPNGSHDDQVDTLTMALLDMQGSHDAARFLAAYAPRDSKQATTARAALSLVS